MPFIFAIFIMQRISSSVRNHLLEHMDELLPLVQRSCHSNKNVRHFRCQVVLSLWKDAISKERRLFLSCSFR